MSETLNSVISLALNSVPTITEEMSPQEVYEALLAIHNAIEILVDYYDEVIADHGSLTGLTDDDHVQYLILTGIRAMTGMLTLRTGAAAVGSAPLKFVSGVLLTTPEAGAVEYSNGHLLFTPAAGARYGMVMTNGVKTSNTAVNNTAVETTIYTKTFIANEIHVDELIIATVIASYSNASAADDFTIRCKLGGATIETLARVGGNVTNAGLEVTFGITIRTDGAGGTYVHYGKMVDDTRVYTSSHVATDAINTTLANTLTVTMQWDTAKAGNVMTAAQGYVQLVH